MAKFFIGWGVNPDPKMQSVVNCGEFETVDLAVSAVENSGLALAEVETVYRADAPKKPNGFILGHGRSLIDGMPIVVVATIKSRNTKTGDMVQTWILRQDMLPTDAVKTGADWSI